MSTSDGPTQYALAQHCHLRSAQRFLAIALTLIISACGGGGGTSAPAQGAPTATVTSITVTPAQVHLYIGDVQQFHATASMSDGTATDFTSNIYWQSTSQQTVQIGIAGVPPGQGKGTGQGTATVSAVYGSIQGSAAVTVGPRPTALQITPTPLYLPKNFSATYRALAGNNDNYTSQDVSSQATWSIGDASLANFVGQPAVVQGIKPGVTSVNGTWTDQYGTAVSGSGYLKILDIDLLRPTGIPFPTPNGPVSPPVAAVNGNGESLFGFGFFNSGEIFTGGYKSDGSYVPATQAATNPESSSKQTRVAINDNGDRLVAWAGQASVYAASATAGQAFGPVITLPGAATPDYLWGTHVDNSGNGYVLWHRGTTLYESRRDHLTGTWGAPLQVATNASNLPTVRYANGVAAVVWGDHIGNETGGPAYDVWAAQTVVDPIQGRIWSAPVKLASDVIEPDYSFAASVNAGGKALVAWTDWRDSAHHLLYWSSGSAGQWSSASMLDSGTSDEPCRVQLAMNASGQGILAWPDWYAYSVHAITYQPATGWGPTVHLRNSGAGLPELAQPQIRQDGRAFLVWKTGFPNQQHKYETKTFMPNAGWSDLGFIDFIGTEGEPYDLSVAANAAGVGSMSWDEAGSVPNPAGGVYDVEYLFSSKFSY